MITYIMLDERHSVPKEFFDSVRAQIEFILPVLKPGRHYTVKRMCGKEYWILLSRTECRDAGRCIVFMVQQEQIPLEHAPFNFTAPYPKKYLLKQ